MKMRVTSTAMLLALALTGCSVTASTSSSGGAGDGLDRATVQAISLKSEKFGIFAKQEPVPLPDKFGASLSSLGAFDVRFAGELDGAEYYIGRNSQLICVVYGKGRTVAQLDGGMFCNSPENEAELGVYSIEKVTKNDQVTVRTIVLVPDNCSAVGIDGGVIDGLKNIQIFPGDSGVLRCPDRSDITIGPGNR